MCLNPNRHLRDAVINYESVHAAAKTLKSVRRWLGPKEMSHLATTTTTRLEEDEINTRRQRIELYVSRHTGDPEALESISELTSNGVVTAGAFEGPSFWRKYVNYSRASKGRLGPL